MSFHFLSHPWDVQNVEDGILVTCAPRDVQAMTNDVLIDELHDLVLENGEKNLQLDLLQVHHVANGVIENLIALNRRLQQNGGRVILCNLNTELYETYQNVGLSDTLDLRMHAYQTS